MAQAASAKEKLRGTTNLREPYDPSALQARVLRGYQGGVTVRDLDTMSYRRFFGLVRELELMLEQERDEYDKARNGGQNNLSAEQGMAVINSEFGQPQEYTGETIKLI